MFSGASRLHSYEETNALGIGIGMNDEMEERSERKVGCECIFEGGETKIHL